MQQYLAPGPAAQPHAGTSERDDTGPHGLSSIKHDAVQAIVRHCLEAEEEVKQAGHPPDEFHARYLVGYLRRTLKSILEECRRLT